MGLRKTLIHRLKDVKDRHEERHRPSGLRMVLADRFSHLNDQHWDSVVQGATFFMTRPYLQALESCRPININPRFALLYRDQSPVAALQAQFVDISAAQMTKKKALKSFKGRFLIAGDLLSTGQHGIVFARGQDPSWLWPGIAEALYRLRRADKLSGQADLVLIKDFNATENGAEVLRRFDYRPVQTQPNMVMEIPSTWKSYEDYLASLTSKYRKAMRETAEQVSQAGYTLEVLKDLEPEASRLHALYMQVQSHAEIRLFELSDAFLPALARNAGDRFCCFVLKKGSETAGFVTTLRDGDTTVGYFIGFDRSVNDTVPIYFRLLQAVIEKAIASGSRSLSLGRTALEPKARIGARPVPTHLWMRHRNPAVNLLVRHLFGLIPHEEPPLRNPFK